MPSSSLLYLLLLFPPSSFTYRYSSSLMEAKRSQSISNCVHLYEALPAAKSVPMLLHTVSSILPGISSGNSACSHRLSGKSCCESRARVCLCLCISCLSICHMPVFVCDYCWNAEVCACHLWGNLLTTGFMVNMHHQHLCARPQICLMDMSHRHPCCPLYPLK